jgi:hypothetical protein
MIDANIWIPHGRDGPLGPEGYADATDAGWTAMRTHKPFILDWMRDVAQRAARSGKRLLTFSHYPALNPFADSALAEAALLGQTPLARRAPTDAAAQAVAATGIGLHVSGHLHVNATTRITGPAQHGLVNVAVPSLAAFPAAYKIVTLTGAVEVQTVGIGQMPMPDLTPYPGSLAGHETYGGFLAAQARHLVSRRLLRREWPADLAAVVPGLTLADMTQTALGADVPALTVIEDWHLLRMGGPFGADLIPADRLALYRAVPPGDTRWAPLLTMIRSYLAQLSSRDFRIDLATGAVTPL